MKCESKNVNLVVRVGWKTKKNTPGLGMTRFITRMPYCYAHTNRLVGVKAVGRVQSVGVCATLRRRSALLRRLTPIQMLNLQSVLDKEVSGDNLAPQTYIR